jgi:beta-phosphoglucomutase-like phosphatase (HAD superfamily)
MPHKISELPAVLFDLDGTLIDSVYEHIFAWWDTLRSARIDVPKWKIHRHVGMSGKSFLKELLRELDLKTHPDLNQLERGHDVRFARAVPHLKPLPGANNLLDHLHACRIPIAIATTGNRKQTLLLLNRLRLPKGLRIVTGDDVEKAKPSPDVFVAAANKLKVNISDCIVVGDSVWDVLAAGRKRALPVSLLSGGYGGDELERAGAFRVYNDPRDLLEHLEHLGLPGNKI